MTNFSKSLPDDPKLTVFLHRITKFSLYYAESYQSIVSLKIPALSDLIKRQKDGNQSLVDSTDHSV